VDDEKLPKLLNSTKFTAVLFFLLVGVAGARVLYMLGQMLMAPSENVTWIDVLQVAYQGLWPFAVGAILWALGEIIDRLAPRD
jgi:hypothetical protein